MMFSNANAPVILYAISYNLQGYLFLERKVIEEKA